MCGLLGFIGESKNPYLTFDLTTKLLLVSEIRGFDATGYWATEKESDGKIAYYKEGIPAEEFVKKDEWKLIEKFNPNLLIAHVRKTSTGVGASFFNQNNHPFVSYDKSLAIIHNGRIEENEYQRLKDCYELNSECDSEIILRIIENGTDNRLIGIKEVFSNIQNGHMAVAVGERAKDKRFLWLFRNKYRPLWVIDLQEILGQIFFISDPDIWDEVIFKNKKFNFLDYQEKIYELPTEEVWLFEFQSVINLQKFKLIKNGTVPLNQNFQKRKIIKKDPVCEIISSLNDFDNIPKNFDFEKFQGICDNSIELICNLKELCENNKDVDFIRNLTMIMEEENIFFHSLIDQMRIL